MAPWLRGTGRLATGACQRESFHGAFKEPHNQNRKQMAAGVTPETPNSLPFCTCSPSLHPSLGFYSTSVPRIIWGALKWKNVLEQTRSISSQDPCTARSFAVSPKHSAELPFMSCSAASLLLREHVTGNQQEEAAERGNNRRKTGRTTRYFSVELKQLQEGVKGSERRCALHFLFTFISFKPVVPKPFSFSSSKVTGEEIVTLIFHRVS